jgi:hypothetical protein
LPPLFPRWPDYVMTTVGVPAKVAGLVLNQSGRADQSHNHGGVSSLC